MIVHEVSEQNGMMKISTLKKSDDEIAGDSKPEGISADTSSELRA